MAFGKKPSRDGRTREPSKAQISGNPIAHLFQMGGEVMFADGGESKTDLGAADPEYTTIFPGSEYSTLSNYFGTLWRPFLRREILKEEETREVAERTIGINPETGMPETMHTIETIPGEYGPIELSDWPTSMEIIHFGIENWLKSKAFLSTPEGREQALDIAQQLPGQAIGGAKDYITQQVGMADRGYQETYDPETGEIKDFNIPQIAAEIMAGSLLRPAVPLANNEFLAGMAVKGKGGVFERATKEGSAMTKPRLDSLLDNYATELQEQGFEGPDIANMIKKAETYFTRDFGTSQDPLRLMLREGRMKPTIDEGWAKLALTAPGLREWQARVARGDYATMSYMDRLQEEMMALEIRRAPEGQLVETGGFDSSVDWEEFKSLRNKLDRLIEQTGGRTTLESPTEAMIDVENIYDQATGLKATIYQDEPLNPVTNLERQQSRDWRESVTDQFNTDIAESIRREQGIQSLTPSEYLYVDRTSEAPPIDYPGSSMEWALKHDEPLWKIHTTPWKYKGLNFLDPKRVGESFSDLGIEAIRRNPADTFPEMLRKGQLSVDPLRKVMRDIKAAGRAGNPLITAVPSTDYLLEKGVRPASTRNDLTNDQWFQIIDPKYTELEGKLMNHSVGDYAIPGNTYNIGGKEAFDSGQARVFSLRDVTTGEPKVTIDVDYADPANPELYMWKGPSNTTQIGEDFEQLFRFIQDNNLSLSHQSMSIRSAFERYLMDGVIYIE